MYRRRRGLAIVVRQLVVAVSGINAAAVVTRNWSERMLEGTAGVVLGGLDVGGWVVATSCGVVVVARRFLVGAFSAWTAAKTHYDDTDNDDADDQSDDDDYSYDYRRYVGAGVVTAARLSWRSSSRP